MVFDLDQVLAENRGENFSLYARNINPQLVRVLRSIGDAKTPTSGSAICGWLATLPRFTSSPRTY